MSIIYGEDFKPGKRDVYEDRVKAEQLKTGSGLNLSVAAVVDGVGGENKGEYAAQLAIDNLFRYLKQGQESDISILLSNAVQAANRAVYAVSSETDGASCTLAVAAVTDANLLFIANVGDSRIYLVRGEKLTQLTMDHTFANIMPLRGKMSKELAQQNPRADVLMWALGQKERVPVDVGFYVGTDDFAVANERGKKGIPLRQGDSILICSDGLIKASPAGEPYTTDDEIISVLNRQEGTDAAKTLVSFALGRDADDNVSAAVLQMPDPQRAARARRPLYAIAGVAALVVLLAIGVIFGLSSRATAETEVQLNATATAEAGAIAATVTADANASAGQLQTEREQVAATATAAAAANEASASEIESQAEQLAATATAAAQSNEVRLTEAAIDVEQANRCKDSRNYDFEVVGGPIYDPEISKEFYQGRVPREVKVSWVLQNTGVCKWQDIRMQPLEGTPDEARPVLLSDPTTEFAEDSEAEFSLLFTFTEQEQLNRGELPHKWIFIVADSDGNDLVLFQQGVLTLDYVEDGEPWIFVIADRDRDGVGDSVDQCPNVAGEERYDGCPDTDGDGFPDNIDACADRPGTINGCPPTPTPTRTPMPVPPTATQPPPTPSPTTPVVPTPTPGPKPTATP